MHIDLSLQLSLGIHRGLVLATPSLFSHLRRRLIPCLLVLKVHVLRHLRFLCYSSSHYPNQYEDVCFTYCEDHLHLCLILDCLARKSDALALMLTSINAIEVQRLLWEMLLSFGRIHLRSKKAFFSFAEKNPFLSFPSLAIIIFCLHSSDRPIPFSLVDTQAKVFDIFTWISMYSYSIGVVCLCFYLLI